MTYGWGWWGMHQLIVLGNGFDLECGLKSKYSDFFKSRVISTQLLKSEKYLEIIKKSEPSSRLAENYGKQTFRRDLTFWDAVLPFSKNDLWKDVEGSIQEFLTEKLPKASNANRLEVTLRYLNCPLTSRRLPILDVIDSEGMASCGFLEAYFDTNRERPPQEVSQLSSLLFSQLQILEKAFGSYLVYAEKKNGFYEERSRNLLKSLLEDDLSQDKLRKDGLPETSVLDFNYTKPASKYVQTNGIHLVNIHGTTNNPIFGIDGTNLMSTLNFLPFTKTYRLLALSNLDRDQIIHTSTTNDGEPTELIKFYGHSFGDADHFYFQAVFDGVNLYSSNTRLIFYYNIWLQDDGRYCSDKIAQQDMFRKVTRLMTEYGATMENKDHGKNLMHKLLLEGRLTIKRYNG